MSSAEFGGATQRDISKEEIDLHPANDIQPARKIVIKGRRVQKRVKKLYFEESDETDSDKDEQTDHLDKRKTAQSSETNDDQTRIFGLRNVFTNSLLPGKILNHWSDSKPAVSLLNATNTVFSRLANTSFLRDKYEDLGNNQSNEKTVIESPLKIAEKQSENLLSLDIAIPSESNECDKDDWDDWGNDFEQNVPFVEESKPDAFSQLIDNDVISPTKQEVESEVVETKSKNDWNSNWADDWGNISEQNIPSAEEPSTGFFDLKPFSQFIGEVNHENYPKSQPFDFAETKHDDQIANNDWNDDWDSNWGNEDELKLNISDQNVQSVKEPSTDFFAKPDASSKLIDDNAISQTKPVDESEVVETKSKNDWDEYRINEDDTKSNVSDQTLPSVEKSPTGVFDSSSELVIDVDHEIHPKSVVPETSIPEKEQSQPFEPKSNFSEQNVPTAEDPSTGLYDSKPFSQFIGEVNHENYPKSQPFDFAETKHDDQIANGEWNDWENEDTKPNISDQNVQSVKEFSIDLYESKPDSPSQLISEVNHEKYLKSVVAETSIHEVKQFLPLDFDGTKNDDQIANSDWNDWENEDITSNISDPIVPFVEETKPDAFSQLIDNDVTSPTKPEVESEVVETKSKNDWDSNWGNEDELKLNISDQNVQSVKEISTDLFEKPDASSQLIDYDVISQPKLETESKVVEKQIDNSLLSNDDWNNDDWGTDSKLNIAALDKSKPFINSDVAFSKLNAFDSASELVSDVNLDLDQYSVSLVAEASKPEKEQSQPFDFAETKHDDQTANSDWIDDWENEDISSNISDQNAPFAEESKPDAFSQLIDNDVISATKHEDESEVVETKSTNDWGSDWKNEDDLISNVSDQNALSVKKSFTDSSSQLIVDANQENYPKSVVAEESKLEMEQSQLFNFAETKHDDQTASSDWIDNWGTEDELKLNISDQNVQSVKEPSTDFFAKPDAPSKLIDDDAISQTKSEDESEVVETKSKNDWDEYRINEDDTKSNVSNQTLPFVEKSPTGIFESKPDSSSKLISDMDHEIRPKSVVLETSIPEMKQSQSLDFSETKDDDQIANTDSNDWGTEDELKLNISYHNAQSVKEISTDFFEKPDASSQLIDHDVISQPKFETESKVVEKQIDNPLLSNDDWNDDWSDDWGNEPKSNISDQNVPFVKESKPDAFSQLIDNDVISPTKSEIKSEVVETASKNDWDSNWKNEDNLISNVSGQNVLSFKKSPIDSSSQLIVDENQESYPKSAVAEESKPKKEQSQPFDFADTKDDDQIANTNDSKPNVAAFDMSKPSINSELAFSKPNASKNLSTNNVSIQPILQSNGQKVMDDKPALLKNITSSKLSKPKVTSTSKLKNSSTSTPLKAPASKNEWANNDWGNDWDDFEPLTLSDRRSSAQTDLSIDSDWSADWEVKPKPKVNQHKPLPSTIPRASKSSKDEHSSPNQPLKSTTLTPSSNVSQMNNQSSVMQSQYQPTPNPQQANAASGASWFSDFRSATRTAALTTVTHAVNRWSFNPTNILDAVVENISSAVGVPSAEEMATVMRQQQRKK